MIIVIDGYNVLKRHFRHDIDEHTRQQFVTSLKRYATHKKHSILVIFDGGDSPRGHRERMGPVEVLYAGSGKSADDALIAYVQKHPGKSMVVVSADRQLGRKAANAGAIILDPEVFMAMLHERASEAKSPQTGLVKTLEQENDMIDALMQEAAHAPFHKEEMASAARPQKGLARKSSKHERQLLEKVKKL